MRNRFKVQGLKFKGFGADLGSKDEGIRAIEEHGHFELNGEAALMETMDELFAAFVDQHRMKLPGKVYVPCYRINKR